MGSKSLWAIDYNKGLGLYPEGNVEPLKGFKKENKMVKFLYRKPFFSAWKILERRQDWSPGDQLQKASFSSSEERQHCLDQWKGIEDEEKEIAKEIITSYYW